MSFSWWENATGTHCDIHHLAEPFQWTRRAPRTGCWKWNRIMRDMPDRAYSIWKSKHENIHVYTLVDHLFEFPSSLSEAGASSYVASFHFRVHVESQHRPLEKSWKRFWRADESWQAKRMKEALSYSWIILDLINAEIRSSSRKMTRSPAVATFIPLHCERGLANYAAEKKSRRKRRTAKSSK